MCNRKPILTLVFLCLATTISTGNVCGQTTSASDAKPSIEEISQVTTAEFNRAFGEMIAEIRAGRALIKAMETETTVQAQTIAKLQEKIALLERANELYGQETAALRAALDLQKQAMAEYKQALEIAKKEVAHQKGVGKRKMKIAFVAGLVMGVGLRLLF